jgi:hypothetical protein
MAELGLPVGGGHAYLIRQCRVGVAENMPTQPGDAELAASGSYDSLQKVRFIQRGTAAGAEYQIIGVVETRIQLHSPQSSDDSGRERHIASAGLCLHRAKFATVEVLPHSERSSRQLLASNRGGLFVEIYPTGDGEVPACRTIFVFKKNWFVLSQTEGAPYEPEPMPAWDKAAALTALNIREEAFVLVDGNTQGYAAVGAATVAISPIAVMPAKTLFHEVAHVLLHRGIDNTAKSLREVEAESVAMICCESLGLPGAEYSRGYVQHWLSGGCIPEKSAQRIFQAADQILKAGRPLQMLNQLPL